MIHTNHRDYSESEWALASITDLDKLAEELLKLGEKDNLTIAEHPRFVVWRFNDRVRLEVEIDYTEDEAHDQMLARL